MEKEERMFGDVNTNKKLIHFKMFRRFTNAFRANAILFSRILLIKILRDKVHKIVSQLSVIMLIVKR